MQNLNYEINLYEIVIYLFNNSLYNINYTIIIFLKIYILINIINVLNYLKKDQSFIIFFNYLINYLLRIQMVY